GVAASGGLDRVDHTRRRESTAGKRSEHDEDTDPPDARTVGVPHDDTPTSRGTREIGLREIGDPTRRGNVSRNCDPDPASPHAWTQPPCSIASSNEIDNPSPVPPIVRVRAGSARQKRLNTRLSSPGPRPTP